jgi:hypothetical protein
MLFHVNKKNCPSDWKLNLASKSTTKTKRSVMGHEVGVEIRSNSAVRKNKYGPYISVLWQRTDHFSDLDKNPVRSPTILCATSTSPSSHFKSFKTKLTYCQIR